jgi:hypothetical protein
MRIALDQASGCGLILDNLRYADETILVAESVSEYRKLILAVKNLSLKFGLHLNNKKTVIMSIDPTRISFELH